MSQTEVQLVKGLNLDPAAPVDATTVDSSGRFLVGTTSNSNNSTAVFQGNSGSSTGGSIVRLAAGTATPSDGSTLGTIGFTDSNHNHAGRIEVKRDGGTWTSNSSHPSRLEFSTTADAASTPTERLRISQSGAFGLSGANYGTSGQALLSQGSGSAPQWGDIAADGAFRSTQVFTTSGTWTKPAGLKRVRVFVTGGGGGGGFPASNTANGGGGAAGGTAIEIIEAGSLGSTETVTVGTGGSAGNPGNTGGTSSFGSHCSATGGTGGSSDSTNTSAYVSGGVGSGGNLNLQGQGGEHGNPGNSFGVGGIGGNSYWGGGGHGGTNYGRPHAGAGANGGGGGGGFRTTAGAVGSGGNGGAGIVYVEQYF